MLKCPSPVLYIQVSAHYDMFIDGEDPRIVTLDGIVYVLDNFHNDMVLREIDVTGTVPRPTGIEIWEQTFLEQTF